MVFFGNRPGATITVSVLLVDDDPSLLEAARIFLEGREGFSVETALSARGALDIVRDTRFDVIVSGYDMPEHTGIDLLQELRARGDETPFIIFTGKGREHVAIEALNSGADFYLQKDADVPVVFAELEQMLQKAAQRGWTEAALKASEERYRAVVESQTELITRFSPEGVILFVNEAYCRYFGKKCNDIIGHRFRPVVPREEQALVREHFASLTPDSPVASLEHRIIMPDGEVRWHQWSDRAIFDSHDRLLEYQSVGRDVTERKFAEEALRQSEERLSKIINHLPEPTFAIDKNARVIAWNRALEGLTGIAAGEMVGAGGCQYAVPFYGERRPALADYILKPDAAALQRYTLITEKEDELTAEVTFPLPQWNGRIFWIKATPLYDNNSAVVGAIESIRDVTEMKRAEAERERLLDEIERRKRLLDTIFDVTPVQFYVYDRDLRYLYVCSKGAEERNVKPEEMIGKTWRDLSMPIGIMEPIEEQLKTVLATGSHLQGEYTFPTASGDKETCTS